MKKIIKESKEYFGYLYSIPVPIIVARAKDGIILFANKKSELLWGYKKEEFLGKRQTFLHPQYWNDKNRETFSNDIKMLRSGESVTHVKNAILRSDGAEISVEITASMIEIEGEEALIGVFTSVQERDEAYALLEEKEREISLIFENSAVGLVYLKNGRFIERVNQHLVDMLGFDSAEDMKGRSVEDVHLSHEHFISFGERYFKALANKEALHIEYQLRKKNGEPIWVSLSGKAVDTNTPADLMKGVIWIVDDITDFKALQEKLEIENKNLQNLLTNINAINCEYDIKRDTFTYVSANTTEILGYAPEEWSNLASWQRMIYEEDREEAVRYCADKTNRAKNHSLEYRMVKKDGTIIWVLDIVTVEQDRDGNPAALYGFLLDVTEQKHLYLQLQNSQKQLQNIIDSVHDPIMVIEEDYTIKVMNHVIKQEVKSLGLEEKEVKCYEIFHNRSTPCDGNDHPCPLQDVMQKKEMVKVVHDHKNHKGENHFVEIVATPYLNERGECIGIIEATRDITEYLELVSHLKEKSSLLEFQAQHDALTGLANRTLFADRVNQAIKKSKRSGKKFAIMFIDLDHFKEINDSLGHAIGDAVLIEASKRITSVIREEDTLARLGGDEFSILINDISNVQDLLPVAQKIITQFHKELLIEGHRLYASCSIGISIYPDDGETKSDLLKNADNAMYKAKSEGRDNFQFYKQEMTELVFERVMLESAMREALEKKQFILYYQPQYDALENKIIGMEALIRWEHPTLGTISPAKFIPIAEGTSLIIEIDNWVMQEGIRQFSQWYAEGLTPGVLSLNLAIKQLESAGFLTRLHETLEQYNFNPKLLKLEILERDMMRNPKENIRKLERLKELGIGFALDDFGTGQSSLTYLKKFPITQLKIDQSFVRHLFIDDVSEVTIRAIIALSEALKIDVIAEGVETQEQLDFLVAHNCKNIQGFYFSRAISAEEMKEKLKM